MAAIPDQNVSNPLLLPEIADFVIDNVRTVPDLLSCACVNSIWSRPALRKLYRGSLIDMQFRTPDIGSLNCLLVASRERFARNMSFVKHLLLSPETPTLDDATRPFRLACFEKCRAMRHRKYAELLLRSQRSGLTSLTIPFEIVDQDWSLVWDLLPPTIGFLAIDHRYCDVLMMSSNLSQGFLSSPHTFSKLRALTIYRSDSNQEIQKLCRLLQRYDLRLFHLEDQCRDESLSFSDTAELLSCLRGQRNLEALALIIPRHTTLLGSATEMPPIEGQKSPWPKLKALYLAEGDQHWLEQLPVLQELQILCLRNVASRIPTIHDCVIGMAAKCRQLRAIDIFFDYFDQGALLQLARSCPLLRKFCVRHSWFSGEAELTEDLFIGLLRALPYLESLELDWKVRMDGTRLQDLARHCPQLTVLHLRRARLSLSLALMEKAQPLRYLEVMRLAGIWFQDARRLMQRNNVLTIETQWRRIFPKLRGMTCPEDVYSHYMEKDYSSGEPEDDAANSDEERSLAEPGLDFDDYESDSFILRTKLWRSLGYSKDMRIHDQVQNKWQMNLEVETVGWPVVPLEAFCDPMSYSTSTNCAR